MRYARSFSEWLLKVETSGSSDLNCGLRVLPAFGVQ